MTNAIAQQYIDLMDTVQHWIYCNQSYVWCPSPYYDLSHYLQITLFYKQHCSYCGKGWKFRDVLLSLRRCNLLMESLKECSKSILWWKWKAYAKWSLIWPIWPTTSEKSWFLLPNLVLLKSENERKQEQRGNRRVGIFIVSYWLRLMACPRAKFLSMIFESFHQSNVARVELIYQK